MIYFTTLFYNIITFLNGRSFSVLGHSTLRHFKRRKWSFVPLHKKRYIQLLQFALFRVFNYYRKSTQIFLRLKFHINSSIQIPLRVKLEILRNSSNIFRRSHRRCSIQKAVLKNFTIFTGKQLWWSLLFKQNCRISSLQLY